MLSSFPNEDLASVAKWLPALQQGMNGGWVGGCLHLSKNWMVGGWLCTLVGNQWEVALYSGSDCMVGDECGVKCVFVLKRQGLKVSRDPHSYTRAVWLTSAVEDIFCASA
jgi:hypothetical protein